MTRHHFSNSFGIDSGGDSSNIPPLEGMSIVIEGLFLSANPNSSASGPAIFTIKGLRKVHATTGSPGSDASFAYSQPATEVKNIHFPVQGRANDGEEVNFTLSAPTEDSAQASGLVTVWGYYADEA